MSEVEKALWLRINREQVYLQLIPLRLGDDPVLEQLDLPPLLGAVGINQVIAEAGLQACFVVDRLRPLRASKTTL
jgi:hypothetical protein